MAHPTGESKNGALKLDFDRRLMVRFRGSVVTSDAGLLAYRELDDALGLTAMASETLADARTGKNGRHALAGLFRQSVFGRLAGYEDVNDAERLRHDPAMRWIVGGKATQGHAASPSQMGRFETQWLAAPANLSALSDLSGQWIDIVHGHRPPKGIVLDMDSSVSPTHGEQEDERLERPFRRERRRGAGCGNHGHLTTNQIGRQCRQAMVLVIGKTVVEHHVLALNMPASFRP
jgi:hypothetical protein